MTNKIPSLLSEIQSEYNMPESTVRVISILSNSEPNTATIQDINTFIT
jgi:hypothetical protein